MLKICILLSFLHISRSFTPPRIIYGGWTPILPGHPFYFGPVRRRNVDYTNSLEYQTHKSPIHEQFHEPPVHNVEHHFEEHIEFVHPGSYNRYANQPENYPHSSGYNNQPPVKTEQISGYSPGKGSYSQHPPESVYKGSPFNSQQITGHDLPKHTYSQISPQPQYNGQQVEGQQISGHDLGKQVVSEYDPVNVQQIAPVHKTNEDTYSYHQPQSQYVEPHGQNLNNGQLVSNVQVSEKDTYVQVPPQSSYDNSHVQQPDKGYSDNNYPVSDPTPNKDIYSYYPPQSVYDGPKEPDTEYKPVYNENPRNPLDILEKTRQQIPYIIPTLKDLPIETLNIRDLNTLHNAGKNTYLQLTPIGEVDPDVIKQLGKIHLDQIKYLGPESGKYPIIKNSLGPTPKHPKFNPYNVNYFKENLPSSKLNYGVSGSHGVAQVPYDIHHTNNYKNANNYKGSTFPLKSHESARIPLNPIETKKYRNSQLQAIKAGKLPVPNVNNYKDITLLSDIPVDPIYPPSSNVFSNAKYRAPTKTLNNPLVIGKNVLPHAIINKNVAKQMNKYLGPRYPTYNPIKPFYPKTTLSGSTVPYSSLPRNPTLIHLPLRTMPRSVLPKPSNYMNKNVKLQTLYKNPSIVANIRGTPALIEREVAIIHVPVQPSHQEYVNANNYPNEKDYLFYTASTPESTQVPDFGNYNRSYVTLDKHSSLFNSSDSYPHIEYGREKGSYSSTYVDPASEEQKSTSQEIDNNSVHNPSYQNEYPYIFVSSSGVHGDNKNHNNNGGHSSNQQDLKKQFFHAYYAPGDHVAPPGYVKMTVHEFNNLFKNAEIRYVDKDPASISRSDTAHNSQSAS